MPHPEQQYMLEMVEARRNGDKVEERYDLFSGLLDAAQDESDNGAGLSDEELVGWYSALQSFGIFWKSILFFLLGNMFIFLFAGHEVGSSPPSRGVTSKPFSTDRSAYPMLYIRPVGSPP
jgi:hypothetical protein